MNADQLDDFKTLLAKYRQGKCTEPERAIVESWLISELSRDIPMPGAQELESADARMHTRMQGYLAGQVVTKVSLWPRMIAAAAAILLVVSAGFFFYRSSVVATESMDIAPGKPGATLTLANGRRIPISKMASGTLAEQSGVIISKSSAGDLIYQVKAGASDSSSINSLTTAKGETVHLRLPDGSQVWLNSASTISYSARLTQQGKRRVKLQGEAFFDVEKDKSHPFVVESGSQQVEVLGTQFNVNSYPDEQQVVTTLVEGSVKISDAGVQKVIKPGQQARNKAGEINIGTVDVDSYIDWKEGDFNLVRLDFEVAMRKISRWYDVKVVYVDPVPAGLKAWGLVSRSQKLSAVLKAMEGSGIAQFKVEGRTIYVSSYNTH